MGCARYVGRVGALAVALGVGVAVATTPGVAWADDPDTEDSAATVDTAPPNPTPEKQPETPSGNTGAGTGPDAITSTTVTGSQITRTFGGEGTPKVTISGSGVDTSGDTDDEQDSAVATASPTPTANPTADPAPTPQADSGAVTPQSTPPTTAPAPIPLAANDNPQPPAGAPADDLTNAQQFITLSDPGTDNPSAGARMMSLTGADDSQNFMAAQFAGDFTTLDAPPPPVNPIETLLAIPGTFISVVLGVFTAALAPVIGPGAPAENPLLWGLLAWVRRQFNQTWANSTPTLAPQQTSQDLDDREVHGTFGGADPDFDTLSYSVPTTGLGAPAHGDVTINQSNGTWTYAPDAGYVGGDTFTVTVTDATSGFHIHALGQRHTDTEDVSVTVAGATNAPPVISNITGPNAPSADGTVTGSFVVTDDDLDSVTVALTANGQPAHGTVDFDIDRDTGLVTYTYTYTSTTAVRLRAGLGEIGPDAFTVAVSDGVNAPATATIDDVSIVSTLAAGPTIQTGVQPWLIGLTPDGTRAYVLNLGTGNDDVGASVTVVDVDPTSDTYNTVLGGPIPLGYAADGLAITPDGTRAYVLVSDDLEGDQEWSLVAVDIVPGSLTYNTVVGDPVPVGLNAYNLRLTPDGTRAYLITGGVFSHDDESSEYVPVQLIVVDVDPTSDTYNTVLGDPIPLVSENTNIYDPEMSPDGTRVYVFTDDGDDSTANATILVIDTDPQSATYNTVIDELPMPADMLIGATFTASGERAYLPVYDEGSAFILDTDPGSPTYGTVLGDPFPAGADGPYLFVLSPDESVLYALTQFGSPTGYLVLIDTTTKTVIGDPIPITITDDMSIGRDGTVYVSVINPDGSSPGWLATFRPTVNPGAVNAPPVISNISAPSVPDSDGTVTGSFVVTDEHLDSIIVALTSNGEPAYGTVDFDVNRTTGLVTYTYTNTATTAERLRAGLGEIGPDAFTVAVSDGVNAPATATIDDVVPIGVTLQASAQIPVGVNPWLVRFTPDGTRAYVLNLGGYPPNQGSVSVIDVDPASATYHTVLGDPIPLGDEPQANGFAITPDGTRAYVVVADDDPNTSGYFVLKVIDIDPDSVTYNTVIGDPIPVGYGAYDLIVTPDGTRAYLINGIETFYEGDDHYTYIPGQFTVVDIDPDSATYNTVVDEITPAVSEARIYYEPVLSPDGTRMYVFSDSVVNGEDATILVIDINPQSATYNAVIDELPLPADVPDGFAFTADGDRAYVAGFYENSVFTIDTDPASPTYGTVLGDPFQVTEGTYHFVLSPDESVLYAIAINTENAGSLTVIDTTTGTAIGDPISLDIMIDISIGPDGTVYVSLSSPEQDQPGWVATFKPVPTVSV